jgi:hypothetical protein
LYLRVDNAPSGERELTVIGARNIPRVYEAQKIKMLSTFAEGFFQVQAELGKKSKEDTDRAMKDELHDREQPGFFDEP